MLATKPERIFGRNGFQEAAIARCERKCLRLLNRHPSHLLVFERLRCALDFCSDEVDEIGEDRILEGIEHPSRRLEADAELFVEFPPGRLFKRFTVMRWRLRAFLVQSSYPPDQYINKGAVRGSQIEPG